MANLVNNSWVRFAVRRSARLFLSVWVLVTATFAMIHLIPGDPVRAALGITAPSSLVNARREALGLNDPIWSQYADYLRGLIHGDLGNSITSGLPVSDVISGRLPATIELGVYAFVLAVMVSIPLGALMGVLTRGGRAPRKELAFTASSVVLGAIPEFLLGVGLVSVFGVHFGWFPVSGRQGVDSYVLPVIALAVSPAAVLARIIRVELLTVLQAEYIRTARAKRLPIRLIYLRHALPNALTATITLGGLMLSGMMVGTVLVETIFAWPGLGSTIVQSILAKDYPMVQASVLVYGLGVLGINLLVDVALALLDPRSTMRGN